MSDSETATFHLEDGEELTEEALKSKLDDVMNAESVTVSCDEKRQVFSKFEPDSYFMAMTTKVGGVGELVSRITDPAERKAAKGIMLGSLLGKLGGQFNFMKKVLHSQIAEDCRAVGIDPATKVNARASEKPKPTEESE